MKLDNVEKHPSYVQVSFSRIESNRGIPFYGANVKSNSYVVLRIDQSEKVNEGHRDWYFARERVLEIRLSPAQFSELLTTMNHGSGVTGTLEFFNPSELPTGKIPEPPYNNSLDLVEKQISNFEGTKLTDKFEKLEKTINELNTSQKNKTALLDQVAMLKQEIKSNLPYYIKVAKQEITKTLSEAKGVIDSFYTSVCTKLGMKALQNKSINEITFKEDNDEF